MVMYLIFMSMFSFGSSSITVKRKHLLLMLLWLEFFVLPLFLGMSFYFMTMGYEYYFSSIFIMFSVCEGALGLSLLVYMNRTHGNDYFRTLSILW